MRTKIVATLGPASMEYGIMNDMVKYGVRIFRLNFSHAEAAYFEPVVNSIRRIEGEIGKPLTVMADLCGPKIRIEEVAGSPLTINKGTTAVLGLEELRSRADEGPFIGLAYPELLKGLEVGMPVSLSDGMLSFVVTRVIDKDRLYLMEAQNGGILTSHKGIAFPGKYHPMPALTAKDRKDLHEALDIGVDAVAVSFVQSASDIVDVRNEIKRHGIWIPVVAKLERKNAYDILEEIVDLSDAVMVARGDLGLECPIASLPIIQKKIIRACRHGQKASIVATQMLLSMVKNPLPTRAETTDVANAILDGADCVMLSEETAIGAYPVEAVRFIHEIAKQSEAYFLERVQGPYRPKQEKNPAKYLAYAAALMADNLESTAIVCHSVSGSTARLLSSRRPAQDIYALSPRPEVVRQMNFFWGVRPRVPDMSITSHVQRVEAFVDGQDELSSEVPVVITSGEPAHGQDHAVTNTIKIFTKSPDLERGGDGS